MRLSIIARDDSGIRTYATKAGAKRVEQRRIQRVLAKNL